MFFPSRDSISYFRFIKKLLLKLFFIISYVYDLLILLVEIDFPDIFAFIIFQALHQALDYSTPV